MRNFMNGFITCIGAVSSILTLMDAFPKYNSIFLLLIGVCVGFWLNSFNRDNSSPSSSGQQPSKPISKPLALLILPALILLAVIAVIHVLGLMTQDLLLIILVFGGLIIFITTIFAVVMLAEPSSGNTGNDDRPHEQ